MPLPALSQIGKTGKQGFDTVWGWADKLGAPVNKLTNKIGSEAFWPTTLDKESEKAARILQSFCKDGFYSTEERPTEEARNLTRYSKQRVVKKIPEEVIKRAKGLAIFTVMRTGLWISGAGGSGVLLARMENGEWSPPSGILIHTAAAGFVFGADIYDCVVVINSDTALESFKAVRATLGGELSAVAGPVGAGAVLDLEIHGKTPPVFTYMKSRGLYAGLGANGTIIIERKDENARFYREEIRAVDILRGKARFVPKYEIQMLMTTIKAAQGDKDVDAQLLPDNRPTPGDLELERMGDQHSVFGLPKAEDPDPFGVHALEGEGFEIKEAGTGRRATVESFEYKPAASSPAYTVLHSRSTSAAGNPSLSQRNSLNTPKHKMSNPKMVYYADNATQTLSLEELEEDIRRDADNRAELAASYKVTGAVSGSHDDEGNPPPLPVRSPPPSLPSRVTGAAAVATDPTSVPFTDNDYTQNDFQRGSVQKDSATVQEPNDIASTYEPGPASLQPGVAQTPETWPAIVPSIEPIYAQPSTMIVDEAPKMPAAVAPGELKTSTPKRKVVGGAYAARFPIRTTEGKTTATNAPSSASTNANVSMPGGFE